jgi:heat shock protein HslJ
VVYEADAEGRSDEKTDSLKVAGALLISPLVTVVSGGPKTPQETRAAQIAIARSLEKFVVVEDAFVGKWEFVRFDGMDDSVVTMKDPKLYTLEISDDGTISGRVEVNRFNGSYTSDGPSLKFDLKAMTMAAPMDPNSYHDKSLNHLGYVRSYVLRDNQLFLSLEADGGIMVFRRANSK